MADTATTASAAAASAANASTDAPPFQLGKPRFQQVRTGLWSACRRVAQGGRENSPPKYLSALGSPTRGHRSLQLVPRGPRPQPPFSHWSVVWARTPTLASYWRAAPSLPDCPRPPALVARGAQRLALTGRGQEYPAPGSELLLRGRSSLFSCPLPAQSSGPALGEKLAWPGCLLTFPPTRIGILS